MPAQPYTHLYMWWQSSPFWIFILNPKHKEPPHHCSGSHGFGNYSPWSPHLLQIKIPLCDNSTWCSLPCNSLRSELTLVQLHFYVTLCIALQSSVYISYFCCPLLINTDLIPSVSVSWREPFERLNTQRENGQTTHDNGTLPPQLLHPAWEAKITKS